MGIDPLTHKPLPPPAQPPALQEPTPDHEEANDEVEEVIKHLTTSLESNISESDKNDVEKELVTNDFCIDEIPVIEPHEILLSCDDNSSLAPSSSSSSTSSSSSYSPKNMLEELHFSPSFDDYCSEIMIDSIWSDDLSSFDLAMNDAERDYNVTTTVEPSLLQYPIMVMDEDYSWNFWCIVQSIFCKLLFNKMVKKIHYNINLSLLSWEEKVMRFEM